MESGIKAYLCPLDHWYDISEILAVNVPLLDVLQNNWSIMNQANLIILLQRVEEPVTKKEVTMEGENPVLDLLKRRDAIHQSHTKSRQSAT